MNCTYFSRDFTLLLSNYNTDISQLPSVFAQYVDKNYLTTHKLVM